MNIDHVHFYVEDAIAWRDWFVKMLEFQPTVTSSTLDTQTVVLQKGTICFILSSPLTSLSPVADYFKQHPAGVVDVAFRVSSVEQATERAIAQGATILQPVQSLNSTPSLKWSQIKGWGDLTHTLIESSSITPRSRWLATRSSETVSSQSWSETGSAIDHLQPSLGAIDHAVLNVAFGELQEAAAWYEAVLGFQRQQRFAIHTEYSGLCSQVLVHPDGTAQLPINEPASASSQIQEFLDHQRGSGIQHIALQTSDIVQAIAQLRQRGLSFLSVPPTYYEQLQSRPGFQLTEAQQQAIAAQEVLVDWQAHNPNAMLLQAFTQPIFGQPTFFFELIQRQHYYINQQCKIAEGFGEGNFRALFEAIEREQKKRGSLT